MHTHACGNTHAHSRPLGYHYLCWTVQLSLCFLLSLAMNSLPLTLFLSLFPIFHFGLASLSFLVRVHIVWSHPYPHNGCSLFFQYGSSLRRAFYILNPVITSVLSPFPLFQKGNPVPLPVIVSFSKIWFWACFPLCAVHSVHLHPQRCI